MFRQLYPFVTLNTLAESGQYARRGNKSSSDEVDLER
jgi:hypothetical protein